MTDLDKINIGIRLWDYDLKARIEAETDFKKHFERLPTKKEILSIFFDNLSNLSKNQTVKVKEICDAAIVLMAEMGGAPTSERGFEDSIYWNFFTKVEKSYALSKWHTQYSDGEIIVCVKILGEIGDLRSLGLLVYGFDYIYDEEKIGPYLYAKTNPGKTASITGTIAISGCNADQSVRGKIQTTL